MSRFSGPQGKGAMRRLKATKREEAETRNTRAKETAEAEVRELQKKQQAKETL